MACDVGQRVLRFAGSESPTATQYLYSEMNLNKVNDIGNNLNPTTHLETALLTADSLLTSL